MFNNKKLLIIAHSYENFVKDQVDIISKQFNHVYVLVRFNPLFEYLNTIPFSKIENILDNYTIKNKLNLKNKPENVTVILTPSTYIPIDTFYNKLGINHFKSVKNTIKKYDIKFDLIHAHFIWSAGYVGLKLKQEYKVPLIITGHGYDVYSLPLKNSYMKNQIVNILSNTDHIITVSEKNKNIIKKLNIKTPISVITNGFDQKQFHVMNINTCKNHLNISQNKKIILSVGNLTPIKGHIYLIKSISKLVKRRNDFQCIIIGNGELKNNLQRYIEELNLSSYIKLIGSKPHDEIPRWINASDLFVLPSLNEGNPTVMFESLACGCPFIGSDVGGISEVITSNKYGCITQPANITDLEQNINWGLNKDWNRSDIANYAIKYTWDNLSKQILLIYQKVLTGTETKQLPKNVKN
jgi:glycosyltransferase involved in cell wall biosynthesis